MDAFLVRRSPFEEHHQRQQQPPAARRAPPSNTSTKRPKHTEKDSPASSEARRDKAAPGSAAASAADSSSSSSAAAAAAASSSSSPSPLAHSGRGSRVVAHFTSRPSSSSRFGPSARQLTLTQLKKVTDVESVKTMTDVLQRAIAREEWTRVRAMLQKLEDDIFVTRAVLEQTGLGLVVAPLKRLNGRATTSATNAAVALPPLESVGAIAAAAASSSAGAASSSSPPPPSIELAESTMPPLDQPMELTSEETKEPESTMKPIDLTTCAADETHDDSTTTPTLEPDVRSQVVALAYRLVATWKEQVTKERDEAELKVTSTSSASLVFSDYSTHKVRIDTYKCFYFRVTTRDARETLAQKTTRRQACGILTPKDLPAARLAADLEGTLWRHHQQEARRRQAERAKKHGVELLSSEKAGGEEEKLAAALAQVPPAYTFHARSLLAIVTAPRTLDKLRQWTATYALGEVQAEEIIQQRKEVLAQLVAASK